VRALRARVTRLIARRHRPGAEGGRPRYLLEAGRIPARGKIQRIPRFTGDTQNLTWASDEVFDIFLMEAILNGLLLGGLLSAALARLNLIFGVIDVVWICYAG